jgi:hypothetical protein
MSPRPQTTGLTNVEVLTYVVADLGGLESAVHLEHVAARAFELMPGAFRWDLDEFSGLIDKDKVRASLTDAEKPSHGGLVRSVGVTKQGQSKKTDFWRLTPAGSEWVATNGVRLAEALNAPRPGLKKGRARDLRKRLENSALYEQFVRKGAIEYSPFDFADLLECSPDASNRVVVERFDALRSQVHLLGDDDLEGFLSMCAEAHRRMLEV